MSIDMNAVDDTTFEDLEKKVENVDRGDNVEPDAKVEPDDKTEEEAKEPDSGKKLAEDIDEELEQIEKENREKREAKRAEKDQQIPKSRFDKALNAARQREEELKTRLEMLEAKQEKEKPNPVKALKEEQLKLQDEYEELLLDGKKDEARKVRRAINDIGEELDMLKSEQSAGIARREALEAARYDLAVAKAETQYPVLNPDSLDYDPETEREVVQLMQTLARGGMARTEALTRAARYVLGNPVAPDTLRNEAAAAEAKKQEMSEKARRKGAEASKRQPPDMTDVGLDSNKVGKNKATNIDLSRISQEQFAKLDEDVVRNLRGDFLET